MSFWIVIARGLTPSLLVFFLWSNSCSGVAIKEISCIAPNDYLQPFVLLHRARGSGYWRDPKHGACWPTVEGPSIWKATRVRLLRHTNKNRFGRSPNRLYPLVAEWACCLVWFDTMPRSTAFLLPVHFLQENWKKEKLFIAVARP